MLKPIAIWVLLLRIKVAREALEGCNKALLLKPNYASAYNNMGNIFKTKVSLDEAIEAFKKALSFQPNYADAYNNMGNALQRSAR